MDVPPRSSRLQGELFYCPWGLCQLARTQSLFCANYRPDWRLNDFLLCCDYREGLVEYEGGCSGMVESVLDNLVLVRFCK